MPLNIEKNLLTEDLSLLKISIGQKILIKLLLKPPISTKVMSQSA